MKVKITAKGYNSNSGTIATQTLETCMMPCEVPMTIGKLIYTVECSGFAINTHEVYLEFIKSTSKIDTNMLTEKFLPVVHNKRFGDNIKITISLAKN